MLHELRNQIGRVGLTAGLVGASIGVALGVSGGSPLPLQFAGSTETAGDVSGPCDEPEHAGDPRCTIGTTPASSSSSSSSSTTSSSTTTPGSTSSTSALPSAPAPEATRTVDAAGAGTVVYVRSGNSLRLVSATPTVGWRVDVEQSAGVEIDLDFRRGTQRVQVDIEFEDGGVRERVRFRDDADDSRIETTNGVVTEQRDGEDREDGDDDRDDASDDDDRDDDRHDSSGPGSGDRDDDGDDDRDDDRDDD